MQLLPKEKDQQEAPMIIHAARVAQRNLLTATGIKAEAAVRNLGWKNEKGHQNALFHALKVISEPERRNKLQKKISIWNLTGIRS